MNLFCTTFPLPWRRVRESVVEKSTGIGVHRLLNIDVHPQYLNADIQEMLQLPSEFDAA